VAGQISPLGILPAADGGVEIGTAPLAAAATFCVLNRPNRRFPALERPLEILAKNGWKDGKGLPTGRGDVLNAVRRSCRIRAG